MKILYFDCFSGISGDMCLGALLGLGVEKETLIAELEKLHVGGWRLEVEKANKNGIDANKVNIFVEDEGHTHRTYKDICVIIDGGKISERAKRLAKAIFKRVAAAEAKVHGVQVDEVAFHEVGALDSIIDIVGVAILIDILNPDKIMSSVLNDGYGFISCRHGQIPVPCPAVMNILADGKIKMRQIDVGMELVTPTGAAIIAELAESFGLMPELTIKRIGYGAGGRDSVIPNVLRVTLGEIGEPSETITVLETNIDDTTPEVLGYVMESLFSAGAKDVFFTHIQMKKNRPAVMLTVICRQAQAAEMERIIFRETTTLGIRQRTENRVCLKREEKVIHSRFGDLTVKSAVFENEEFIYPEYENCKQFAQTHQIPLKCVYDEVRNAAASQC